MKQLFAILLLTILYANNTTIDTNKTKEKNWHKKDTQALTNSSLQTKIESILSKAKTELNATEVMAMVMESKSGHLLALASSDAQNNRYASYLYEPGAVVMPFVVAAALDAGKLQHDEQIALHGGSIKVGGLTVRDNAKIIRNSLSVTEVITHSSNVGIVQIAQRLSGVELGVGLRGFGLGSVEGIDLPGARKGVIKNDSQLQKELYRATTAYGYGIAVTPVQLMRAYASLRNGGILPSCYIAEKSNIPPMRAASFATAKQVAQMLVANVKVGSGTKAAVAGLVIGGKTGTAHIAKEGRYVNSYNSSFFGFAEDGARHSYTIGVVAVDPKAKGKHLASQSAAPVFRQIVDAMVAQKMLLPSKPQTTRSAKAHAPLTDMEVVKPYGSYTDPTYGIKIFNESVTLRPKSVDKRVYAILDGKVLFAGKSSLLGNIVVVAHANDLKSVYAELSKIAPETKVGTSLQRGDTIGSVEGTLVFQTLWGNQYIDPVQLVGVD
ncbi:MAG: peptidoglycan DD-metalloendopeptidase family protein [Sulfurovum sp.]|nr:peptidoglycan DD-metalloendopeptidase family protein [Sulfurovum sp.]